MKKTPQDCTILIIEDEADLREALADAFGRENFPVLVANNGEEGLQMAKDRHPDLMLVDVVMPRMDGMTMLKKLREDAWGKSAKAIILSNLNDAGSDGESPDHGGYDYLIKSDWKMEDVIKKAKSSLGI